MYEYFFIYIFLTITLSSLLSVPPFLFQKSRQGTGEWEYEKLRTQRLHNASLSVRTRRSLPFSTRTKASEDVTSLLIPYCS